LSRRGRKGWSRGGNRAPNVRLWFLTWWWQACKTSEPSGANPSNGKSDGKFRQTNLPQEKLVDRSYIINEYNEDNLIKIVIISEDNFGGAINLHHSVYDLSVANSAIVLDTWKKLHCTCMIASLFEMVYTLFGYHYPKASQETLDCSMSQHCNSCSFNGFSFDFFLACCIFQP